MVTCRKCKQKFDAQANEKDIIWCMPSMNHYYHIECYDNKRDIEKEKDEAEWASLIYNFFSQDLKVSYNWYLCESQRKKFVAENKFTNKGIYFALKYFYEIKKGTWDKSQGGLGIVPYIYEESKQYWYEQERKRKGFVAMIEEQIKERENRETIKIARPQKRERKDKFNLDDIGGEEE